jgi:hypothetical protein
MWVNHFIVHGPMQSSALAASIAVDPVGKAPPILEHDLHPIGSPPHHLAMVLFKGPSHAACLFHIPHAAAAAQSTRPNT